MTATCRYTNGPLGSQDIAGDIEENVQAGECCGLQGSWFVAARSWRHALIARRVRQIASVLHRGMTERQLAEVSSNRVPDTIVVTMCGDETPQPFPCKVFVYDGGLRDGQYDSRLAVVLEDVRGEWRVGQWI
jgi:hypothetical protein